MPNLNEIVYDYSPALHGPHKTLEGTPYYEQDPELYREEPYIIMQMIEGENLGDYLGGSIEAVLETREYDRYRYWERDVLQQALELCTIFQEFHRVDRQQKNSYFIYQDLKPDNIMITYGTFITLIDFGGMTLVRDDEHGVPYSNWEGCGSAGLGTWGYKAPEMDPANGMLGQLDQRVDVYALGATLFHLLTTIDPTKLPNEYGVLPYEQLKQVGCTNATYELIVKATQPDRDLRFADMREMKSQVFEAIKELKRVG